MAEILPTSVNHGYTCLIVPASEVVQRPFAYARMHQSLGLACMEHMDVGVYTVRVMPVLDTWFVSSNL
jgi:hypothetical protein